MSHGHAAPTAILLSNAVVIEKCPDATVVGDLTAVDPTPGHSHSFTLVAGVGSDDNSRFLIAGNQLLVAVGRNLDFETQPELSIRVRVTDATNLTYEQAFAIVLTDDRQEDADGDGLSQMDEEDIDGTSDLLFDTDGDGVGDGLEVAARTSPTNANDWPQSSVIGWGHSADGEQTTPPDNGMVALSTGQSHSLALTANGAVVAWGGHNTYGQATVPADLGEVVAIATGGDGWLDDSSHSMALKRDGTVVTWGYDQEQRTNVPAGLNQVVATAAGRTHCLALKRDGTVVTWGYNPFGSIDPPPGLGNVVAVTAGGFQCLALKTDGSVVAWGSNFNGDGWENASVPVGLSDVVAVAAGRFHCLALKHDGTVVAWGYNLNGQTDVPAGLGGVVAVAAGGFHSLALKNDGTVVAWGLNTAGQTNVPAAAQGNVRMISAGILHSLGLRRNAALPLITSSPRILAVPNLAFAFPVVLANAGDANLTFAAIGLPDGVTIDATTGIISGSVTVPMRRSIRIQVNTTHGMLTQAAWLGISEGQPPTAVQLNCPGLLENSTPGVVVGTLSALDPDEGDTHTFEWVDGMGSTDNKYFRIEGNQLIVALPITRDFEQDPSAFSIRVRARDASLNPLEAVITFPFFDDRMEDADGDGLSEEQEEDIFQTSDVQSDTDDDGFGDLFEITRGLLPNDAASFPTGQMVLAWGNPDEGQTDPPPGLEEFIDLTAGGGHNLALKYDGTVVAWGADGDGQCTLPEGLQDVTAVAAGNRHCLVLKRDGTVAAWGNNDFGQSAVPAALGQVVAIAAGGVHNLALKRDGSVVAWGYDRYGQVTVPAGLTGVVAIAAGGFHSLALKSDGTVVAWGSDWDGTVSVPADLTGVVAIAAGGYHCLALKHDGTVVAWGSNAAAQTAIPAGLANVTSIAAGALHSLALLADGTMSAWGDDTHGQASIPREASHIQRIGAGFSHNLALRQDSGFPSFADASPVRSWPGETVAHPIVIQNAIPLQFSAIGLPTDLALDPASGLVTGTVTSGQRGSVRLMIETDKGPLSRVVWFNTVDGVPPDGIALSSTTLAENTPAGTVVGTFSVTDPNAGDAASVSLAYVPDAPDSHRFFVADNRLITNNKVAADYDAGTTELSIRVVARDTGGNTLERDFVLQLTDDRSEDADADGLSEATEEDMLGTSDVSFDDFNSADADDDGVPSLIEYAFNLDAKTPGPPLRLAAGANSTAGLPAIELVQDGPGQRRLRLEYLRRVGNGLVYTPEFASGLMPEDWLPATRPVVVTPVSAEWERCVVEDSLSTAEAACRFGRVAITW